jgi:ubiquinone/menaquinone biosynthesis C-methylase UbiE
MQQKNLFDEIAGEYDQEFSLTMVGKSQREIVWNILSKRIVPGMEILEIACGTGEDAIFFARKGCKVLATDGSEKMISLCLDKIRNEKVLVLPEFRKASFDEIRNVAGTLRFDIIFSDFSGINCIDPGSLQNLAGEFNYLMKPGGKVILVVFAKDCLWEKIFMLVKGRYKEINRRRKKSQVAGLALSMMPVFYYSAHELKKSLDKSFIFKAKRPVGLFIPPSYLNPFFSNKKYLVRVLMFLDKLFGRFSFLSGFSDHYLIEFVKK